MAGKSHTKMASQSNKAVTRSHAQKLAKLLPAFTNQPWIKPGLSFSPKRRPRHVEYTPSPVHGLGYLSYNDEAFHPDLDFELGEPAIDYELQPFVSSHFTRVKGGEKMYWAREDWAENGREILDEEDRAREKRRKEKMVRERNGGMKAAQRRRKWKLSQRALIKVEEVDEQAKTDHEKNCGEFELGGEGDVGEEMDYEPSVESVFEIEIGKTEKRGLTPRDILFRRRNYVDWGG